MKYFADNFYYPTLKSYKQTNYGNLTHPFNLIDPEEIVTRVMGDNAFNFMLKYYD
ncbi:MAG TPA: hypothetical protein VFC65_02200 [Prolixibacteraceae bacterium]|nr:hypothetical protein [Prolixibacteraceae bacterium]